MKVYFLSMLLLLSCITIAFTHGGKKHKKDSTTQADSLHHNKEEAHSQGDTVHHHSEGMKIDESKVKAELNDFPTLHPFIVHFAIVLIIVAAALQLLNIFLLKNDFVWIIAFLLLVGFTTAYLASSKFHPHTHGISEHAKLVLNQHDKWADWTIYTAALGVVLQIAYLIFIRIKSKKHTGTVSAEVNNSFLKIKQLSILIIAIVLATSAYCVLMAGHYGAQLVHIEGIGPQGKYLEMEHHH